MTTTPTIPTAAIKPPTDALRNLAESYRDVLGSAVLDYYIGLRQGERMPEATAAMLTKEFQAALIERLLPARSTPSGQGGAAILQQIVAGLTALAAAQKKP